MSEKPPVFMLAQLRACKDKDIALSTKTEALTEKAFKSEGAQKLEYRWRKSLLLLALLSSSFLDIHYGPL